MTRPKREQLEKRRLALEAERSYVLTHWQELSLRYSPRSGRFFTGDRHATKGGASAYNAIIDNTGPRCAKITSAGMMSHITSPARPWFALTTPDPELAKYHPVKVWLEDTRQRMLRVFAKSNTYKMLRTVYETSVVYGTAASLLLPDFSNVIHHHMVPIGEFCLAADPQERINTFFRKFQMTVAQMVREFGREQCSHAVRNLFDRGELDLYIDVVHVIEPRHDRDVTKSDALNMPWLSIYYEVGSRENEVLRESGFRNFPVLCPRWIVQPGEVYGESPGMEALGDVKALQHEQLRKADVIDLQTSPPLQVPSNLKNRDVDTLPGGVTFVDSMSAQAGIRPMWQTDLRLDYLLEDIRDIRERVRAAFFADLFAMLEMAGTDTRMTATEVAVRNEERLTQLGPVLENLQTELLSPLINLTFDHMFEAGALLPPPLELSGMMLEVEFVSVLAQAQRAVNTNAVDRFVGNLTAVAGAKPDVLDKFDADAWADNYASMLGVDPALIVPDEEVQAVREARNKAQAAQAQSAMLAEQAGAAKDLAAAPTTGEPTALTDMMGMFSGYNSPSATQV